MLAEANRPGRRKRPAHAGLLGELRPNQGLGGAESSEFVFVEDEFVLLGGFAVGALAGADAVEVPFVVVGVVVVGVVVVCAAGLCGAVLLALPPIGVEIADAGVIPLLASLLPTGLEMAEAGVIPGIGALVVRGPVTLVSPGNGVVVAVGPVMVSPGMFVFPTGAFTVSPAGGTSVESDIGAAVAGIPTAVEPFRVGTVLPGTVPALGTVPVLVGTDCVGTLLPLCVGIVVPLCVGTLPPV